MKILRLINPIYFFSLFLLLFPTIKIGTVESHQIGKSLILLILVILFSKKKLLRVENKNELILFTLLLVTQVLSILNALNITMFLYKIKNLIFLYLFYIVSLKILCNSDNYKHYARIVFMVSFGSAIITIFFSINPNDNLTFVEHIFHPTFAERIRIHLENFKIYWESYEEVTIPIIFSSALPSLIILIYTSTVLLSAIITNFRTRVLMALFSIFFTFILLKGNLKKKTIAICTIFVILTALISSIAISQQKSIENYSLVFERFALTNEPDIRSINFRVEQWMNTFDIVTTKPFLGVGLGNYQEYFTNQKNSRATGKSSLLRNSLIDSIDPHNIFIITLAETGFIGFAARALLLGYFVKKDYVIFRTSDQKRPFIISFWILFMYSLFNPTDNTPYGVLYLSIRAII